MTQFKLEEFESGGEHTVEQRQQKLTGMIVEQHLDKIRHEYQQHEEHEQVLQQEQKEQQRLQQQEQQRLLQQQEQQRLLQQQEQQRLLQQQEQQRLLQQQEQQRLQQQEQQRLLEQQRLVQQQEQQRLLQQQEQQRLLQQQEQEQRLQNQLVKQMSAPVPPVRPSVSRTNTDNTASSPVHRSRVLPPIPTRQTSAVPINQPPTSFSSPYPPGFSTSAPVANSHFVPSLSQQQQPFSLQSFPWYHGDISRDIAVKRLEEFSMKDG